MIPKGIQTNVTLAPYTTLGIGGEAEYFFEANTLDELMSAVSWAAREHHAIAVLGGGSNILVGDGGVKGLVIHMCISDTRYEDNKDRIRVTFGAGRMLDECVREVVERGLWGLENLSAIPGTVGATPIQNVGAYGVEVKDVISAVITYDVLHQTLRTFNTAECEFGYRESFFKHDKGKQYIVVGVTFNLSKRPDPKLEYKDLREYWSAGHVPTLTEIRDAIITIRRNKFPDWKILGTAGSFFKNPTIAVSSYEDLKKSYPDLPGFTQNDGSVKVSLGWILDHVLNKKGYREGNVGLYEKQALVLVNHGNATAREVEIFSGKIVDEVKNKTGITVEREVTLFARSHT